MRGLAPLLVMLVLAGCATEAEPTMTLAQQPAPQTAAAAPPAPPYQLTKEELALDCRKLAGRMYVRISQMRNDAERARTTALSQTAQSLSTPVFGGTKRGADPAGDLARDRAQLAAYNARLAEKKCKTVDIEAELARAGGGPVVPQSVTAPKK